MKNVSKNIVLFSIGGVIYLMIEVIWRYLMNRPDTHWTMFIVGGLAFLIIGSINEYFTWEIPIWLQSIIGTIAVTVLEFISGCVLNIWLGLNIWDYSNVPLNLFGQICVPFMGAWIILVTIAIIVDDYFRWLIYKEEMPRYQWWFSA